MKNKIALVTGASRGIGAALAKQLGSAGAQTILLGRTVGGLEETDDAIRLSGGLPAVLVPIDFTKADTEFDQLGQKIYERFGKLNYFFACAAILGPLSPVGHIRPQDWQNVMDVNLHANYRLIRSLDPLLRQSADARAIFLTCSQGSMAEAYWGAYGSSKAGLERLAQSYAQEMKNLHVTVDIFDPGPCATRLRAQAFPGEDAKQLLTPEDAATRLIATL